MLATFWRWFVRISLWSLLVLVSAILPACICAPTNQDPQARPILACKVQRGASAIASPLQTKTIVPGAIATAISTTDSGDAALRIEMTPPPGRVATPDLFLQYSSGSDHDSTIGVGFSLSAGSAITRCAKGNIVDNAVRSVQFDAEDAYCLDQKRLVVIATNGNTLEYRTFPDTNVNVIGHFEDPAASFFEVLFPDGRRMLYGSTSATRPMANTRVPQAWLADVQTDPRGNEVHYDWCFAEDDSGYVAEYALTSIRYAPDRAVVFSYDQRDDARTMYVQGMQLQQSLQLASVEMQAVGEVVRRYELTYAPSATTGRALLESVQACAGDGSCYGSTQLQYATPKPGFYDVATNIAAPLSDKASPMLFDIDHDGLPEYVVGDSTPFSTPEHPVTEWRVAKNLGGAFTPEKVALLQEWSFAQDPVEPADPTFLQPELGTAIDFTGGRKT